MIRLAFAVVFSFIIICAGVYGIEYIYGRQSAFDTDTAGLGRSSIYFVFMVIGTLASERYKYFVANENAGLNFFKNISYSYLYRSLLVSPMVFAAVVTYIGKDANIVMATIFSFQNGFFWETIFNNKASHVLLGDTPEVAPR